MKYILFFTFLFVFLIPSFGQEKYRVTYNYLTDEVNYYKLNKLNKVQDTLNKPKFKRNSMIELKLLNVNPFAVSVKTDVKEEAMHSNKSNGFNFSSLLGGIGGFSGESLNLNVNNLPKDASFFTRGDKSRGSLNNKFSNLNELTSNVEAIKSTLMSNLLNPNLDKSTIVNNLKKIASKIKDARLPDPNENFYLFISSLDNIVKEDTKELENNIATISSDIDKSLNSDKALSRGELVLRTNSYNSLKNLSSGIERNQKKTTNNLAKIQSLFTTLEASNFEQTYDYLIEADKANVELKFNQSNFSEASSQKNEKVTVKTRNIKLFSKGGFKVNTSVALTLNSFGDKSKDFYVDENGKIGQDVNNYFVPNLSTMINFYPVIGENFNIGGSFGLSIPITGESKGVNFLLGPSIFLGSKSRLSLSGGLAYGPVNKLTNGLKVGEETTAIDIDGFTKSIYDFGYYFGISFSLFDIK